MKDRAHERGYVTPAVHGTLEELRPNHTRVLADLTILVHRDINHMILPSMISSGRILVVVPNSSPILPRVSGSNMPVKSASMLLRVFWIQRWTLAQPVIFHRLEFRVLPTVRLCSAE